MRQSESVTLIEVGPRDGFQFESKIVPTELKRRIISELVDAGLGHIQVTSFVHPDRVPQMADAEALAAGLPRSGTVEFSALVLNERGVERAAGSGLTTIEVSVSASDAHGRRNTGMSLPQAIEAGKRMMDRARQLGMKVRAGVQCAFGHHRKDRVPITRVSRMVREFAELGADWLCLADTSGMATPPAVRRMLDAVGPSVADIPLVLHLHDTRGLGLVNVMAALEFGIRHFDTALGGMGGCPFIKGAAGNVATEDTLYLMESLGVATGVDIGRVARCTLELEGFFGKRFPGRMHRVLDSDGSLYRLPR